MRCLRAAICCVFAAVALTTALPAHAQQPQVVTVVEYYNATMDHYFMTWLPAEVALCDAQSPPCEGWVRTGQSFKTYGPGWWRISENPRDAPVCRFFNDSFAPKSSHFYAMKGAGCEETLEFFPDWELETDELFDARFPLGEFCDRFERPVYRLYNNGMGGAPNHRFTTDENVARAMMAQGWTPEGFSSGFAFCILNLV